MPDHTHARAHTHTRVRAHQTVMFVGSGLMMTGAENNLWPDHMGAAFVTVRGSNHLLSWLLVSGG